MTCALCSVDSSVTVTAHDAAGERELCVGCYLRRAKEDAEWLADWRKHEAAYQTKYGKATP